MSEFGYVPVLVTARLNGAAYDKYMGRSLQRLLCSLRLMLIKKIGEEKTMTFTYPAVFTEKEDGKRLSRILSGSGDV